MLRAPCIALLSILLAPPAAAAGLDLIFAADLGGHLSPRRCAGPDLAVGPGLGALAAAVARAQEGAAASLVIGGPGLLGPGALSRYLLASGAGSAHAARLLGAAGIEVLVPGTYEFASDPAGLRAYLEAHRAAGRTAILSNLDCSGGVGACRSIRRAQIIERGGLRVALLGVVSEGLRQRVRKDHLPGPVMAPGTIAQEVRRLREREGAQAVIVVSELDAEPSPEGAVALVQGLEAQGAHVDVVLAARQDHPDAAVTTLALSSGTVVVGAPSGGAGVARVSLAWGSGGLEVRARRLLAGAPDASIGAQVAEVHGRMCAEWGRAVAPLPRGGLGRARLLAVTLDAMRFFAHADIAFINAGALDDRGLPLLSASAAEVWAALPFRAEVVRVRATGKAIAEHLGRYAPRTGEPPFSDVPYRRAGRGPRAQALSLLGLLRDGDTLKVNGRALDPAATYRMATIDFVAAGGDALLPPEFTKGDLAAKGASLQEVLLEHLAAGHDAAVALSERPLWTSGLDFGVDLQSVTVTTPESAAYDRPLLLRRPAVALKIDATARFQMDQPAHLVQLTVRSLYGQTYFSRGQGAEEGPAWQETADLLSATLLYSYRGLTSRRQIVPTPFSSVGIEAEWSRPAQRAYHHLEISSLAGVRMALAPRISVSAGVGARRELLALSWSSSPTEADLARARFLFSATIEVLKRALWPRLGNALLGELSLTYNFTDPQVLRSHELRSMGKLHVALGRPLYIALGLDLYLYADRGRDPGVALDVTAGLKVLLDARRQMF